MCLNLSVQALCCLREAVNIASEMKIGDTQHLYGVQVPVIIGLLDCRGKVQALQTQRAEQERWIQCREQMCGVT